MLTRRAFAVLGTGAGLMGLLGMLGCGKAPEYEGRLIRSVLYYSGGGMTGGGDSSELRRQDDGSAILSTRSREWHDSRETGFDYAVDGSVFDRIAKIVNEYDLFAASKRKMSNVQVLDAPTSSLYIDTMLEDGTYDLDSSIRISSGQNLTDRDREGVRAVVTALAEIAGESEGTPYAEPITITLSIDGMQLDFIMNDSSASRDLAQRCPLDIEVENYADNEKIFYLDEPLDTSDTPLATGAAGTLCYFEPWNDVVFFYRDGLPYEGLYGLGRAESDSVTSILGDFEPGKARLYSNIPSEWGGCR